MPLTDICDCDSHPSLLHSFLCPHDTITKNGREIFVQAVFLPVTADVGQKAATHNFMYSGHLFVDSRERVYLSMKFYRLSLFAGRC